MVINYNTAVDPNKMWLMATEIGTSSTELCLDRVLTTSVSSINCKNGFENS